MIFTALLVAVGIYNTPANRLHRQLDLGNRYLEEGQYEQAALVFEKAIAIDDRCMEAYLGGLRAYLGAGDMDDTQDFYERTLAMLAELDEDFLSENMDYAVELYLAVEEVYSGDRDRIAQVLEEGYSVTGEDARIKEKLVENYIAMGKEKTEEADYENALTAYDRLLELDSTNSEMINDLCDCLNQYIDVLMEAKQYDTIRALAEKYGDVAVNVNFTAILEQIAELERIEAENRAFMQKIYDLMAAQDYGDRMYEALFYDEAHFSEETRAFLDRMEEDYYIYFPDENASLNGVGATIYRAIYDDGTYVRIYYGDYVKGERKGSGTLLSPQSDGSYYVFTGEWDQDAPNGEGIVTEVGFSSDSGTRYDKVDHGMLVNGLWDGQVNAILTDSESGEEYDLSFTAVKGIPTE
ncbi:MAG: hypothetical protein NC416_08840, partial [Eubacterium sp.]|nr:hypothetical protein [Eubacterium sp.]